MAHIDSQVDLFALDDFKFALVLLHIDSDKLIADLGGVFRGVCEAELRFVFLHLIEILLLCLLIAFTALFPADLVEALTEEDHKGEDSAIKGIIDLLAHSVEVEGKDLIDLHAELLLLC